MNGDGGNSQIVKIDLEEEEKEVGSLNELPPHDRARLTLATWFLVSLGALMLGSWLLMVFGPEARLAETREIFNFVKTVVPPLITLVIGFYFNTQSE